MNRYSIIWTLVSGYCVVPHMTHDDNSTKQNGYPGVLPPLLSTHAPSSAAESIRLTGQRVRFVHQEIEPFPSLQDGVDVLDHDVLSEGGQPDLELIPVGLHIVEVGARLL